MFPINTMHFRNTCYNGFQELFAPKKNDNSTKNSSLLKILSYFQFTIPLSFQSTYSLYSKISQKSTLSKEDLKIDLLAQNKLNPLLIEGKNKTLTLLKRLQQNSLQSNNQCIKN